MSVPLGALLARLRDRMFPPPLDTVAALERFVGERAAFVAQTSLYGYLKTRMGMKFPRYFEDPGFAALIRTARSPAELTNSLTDAVRISAAKPGSSK